MSISKNERGRKKMQAYRMIVKTETVGTDGRTLKTREIIGHLMENELPARRNAAKLSAPHGSIRTIRVVPQI
jgi:hypothetical protein